MMANKNWYITLTLLLVFASCKKKDGDTNQLGQLLISDAYSLVLSDPADPTNGAKLFKLPVSINSINLEEVKYIAKDGSEMVGHYTPEGIYDLGSDYFMLTLSLSKKTPKAYETYLIRNIDGIAIQVSPEFHPMRSESGNWLDDDRVKPLKKGSELIYYCVTSTHLQRVNILGSGRFEFKSFNVPNITDNNFSVDYQGHVMIGNTFIQSVDSILPVTSFDPANMLTVKSYKNGFNLVKLNDNIITVSHLYLQDNQLKEDSLTTLSQDHTGWQFLNAFAFYDFNQTLVIFDQAIISIAPAGTKIIPLSQFNLKTISFTDQSLDHYFLVGTDLGDEKVVLQIDPSHTPQTYSQLFAPDLFDVKKFHVSNTNAITIMAVRNSDSQEVFRRIKSGTIKDVNNSQAILTKQVYTIK